MTRVAYDVHRSISYNYFQLNYILWRPNFKTFYRYKYIIFYDWWIGLGKPDVSFWFDVKIQVILYYHDSFIWHSTERSILIIMDLRLKPITFYIHISLDTESTWPGFLIQEITMCFYSSWQAACICLQYLTFQHKCPLKNQLAWFRH